MVTGWRLFGVGVTISNTQWQLDDICLVLQSVTVLTHCGNWVTFVWCCNRCWCYNAGFTVNVGVGVTMLLLQSIAHSGNWMTFV